MREAGGASGAQCDGMDSERDRKIGICRRLIEPRFKSKRSCRFDRKFNQR
jgi:hypothetical protein